VADRRRVAVLGFDCPVMPFLEDFMAKGLLPNLKKLVDGGVLADNCLVPYPTITPPNWTTLATGAHIGTHQVPDFWKPTPGKPNESQFWPPAFSSNNIKAGVDTIWDAADRAGLKCVVLNWPGSWPTKMKNGIMVGGNGLLAMDQNDGWKSARESLCGAHLITTGMYPRAIRVKLQEAEDWENADELGEDPLEAAAKLNYPNAEDPVAPATWYVLVRKGDGDAYETVTLSPTKDLKDAFCTLKVGQWSKKLSTTMKLADGTEKVVTFGCKLLELSDDAEDLRFYISALGNFSKRCFPAGIDEKIESEEGLLIPFCGLQETELGSNWITWEDYAETSGKHGRWVADAAYSLLKDGDWDLFCMHSHPHDFSYHVLMAGMDPMNNPDDEVKRARANAAHQKIYEDQDKCLGRILEAIPEGTLIVVVSDHGAVADGPTFDPYVPLQAIGATVVAPRRELTPEEKMAAKYGQIPREIDFAKSKALATGSCYIFIQLQGRDINGVVPPEDYEKLQRQIIDALYAYVDPETGRRPVALALTKNDARLLGLYGDNVGDVVYATYPWFGSQHGGILPTAVWSLGSLRGLWAFNGPNIRKGVRLTRTVHLEDIVPTICYAADLPVPATVDGAVVFQIFEEPEFRQKEMAALGEALAKAEATLSSGQG
jgi:predicted AlkP superfamily phosphohydrolase/phosphomutase